MPKTHHPRRGSMQFWPRKRSRHNLARIRSWAKDNKVKPLGFIGYKAGMTHLHIVDNRPKSPTKGENIFASATIIECPPMTVIGVSFYKNNLFGVRKLSSIMAEKLPKELSRKIKLPKKQNKRFGEITEFDDLRLMVQSNPKAVSPLGAKKPKLLEIALGGSKEDKLKFAQEVLGKEIKVEDVLEAGNYADVHGISKGKGFQGTVKRFGVPVRQHKAEKTKRGIGTLGPWTPKRVLFHVPQPGKMGFHLRTEYNKQIIKIGQEGKEVTPKGGITKYGTVRNAYVLVKGSVVGPRKRAVVLTQGIRINPKANKEAIEVTYISAKK